jgi:hypothetical protein
MSIPIFNAWSQETFIPELPGRREAFQHAGPAVLILFGFSVRGGDGTRDLSSKKVEAFGDDVAELFCNFEDE